MRLWGETSTGFRPRVAVVLLIVVSHLLVALGLPMPAPVVKIDSDNPGQPFPCQNRPCGCQVAEDCSGGCCCCSGKQEPVEEPPSCCGSEPAPVRWVIGAFVAKCRGVGPAGLLQCEPATPLTSGHSLSFVPEPAGFVIDRPFPLLSSTHPPLTPPPRQV